MDGWVRPCVAFWRWWGLLGAFLHRSLVLKRLRGSLSFVASFILARDVTQKDSSQPIWTVKRHTNKIGLCFHWLHLSWIELLSARWPLYGFEVPPAWTRFHRFFLPPVGWEPLSRWQQWGNHAFFKIGYTADSTLQSVQSTMSYD